ncbi:MAG TPA: hypothetical protein VK589_08510 [Chryseolinea sp.]|nr:hypothetical protein [Chryseolinea sp.]
MAIKTCLLITDDPDDHVAISEAISEIDKDMIVLLVLESEKALELLKGNAHIPHYIFLDLSTHGLQSNNFLNTITKDENLHRIPTIVYGESTSFDKIEKKDGLVFFKKEYAYSELQYFLKTLLKKNMG